MFATSCSVPSIVPPHTVCLCSDCRYRVFLGNGRYFVSSDVGGGKMQWYAFHKEAAGALPAP